MKKLFQTLPGLLVGGLLILSACQMENAALDEPLAPAEASPLARMSYVKWPGESNYEQLGAVEGVTVVACCGQPHAGSGDSDAASGIDNNTATWWHPNWSSNTSGHTTDTTPWTEGGGYSTVAEYINEETSDPASGVQNGQGGHWITLDLGEQVDNLAALAYLGRTQTDRMIRGYEIWVSNSPIQWDVSGATLAAKGVWGTGNEYKYARFVPQSVQYIQLRQLRRIDDVTSTGDYGCVANLQVETSTSTVPGMDKSLLISAYTQGSVLLKTLDPSTPRHNVLAEALASAKETLGDPGLEDFPLAGQSSIDAAAETLLALINSLDPPPKPPED
ncbi:MAG: hypothetical protein LBB83_03760 [Treponema sp.]|jgi:hypothetical protein|nr:hypothetical protein [Treponema sp.]